jgi:hypothetical protein
MMRPWNGVSGWRAILPVFVLFHSKYEAKKFLITVGSCHKAAYENDFQHDESRK